MLTRCQHVIHGHIQIWPTVRVMATAVMSSATPIPGANQGSPTALSRHCLIRSLKPSRSFHDIDTF